jgi:uncharacterized protein DUF3291
MTDHAWHLAQLNVARALAPLDSPTLSPFMAQLEGINQLAEASPGFIWRLKGDGGNATDIRVGDDPQLIVNLTVWASVESLFDFVYRTPHTGVMAARRQWFEKPVQAHQVLWWVPAGHVPTIAEAFDRLSLLRKAGSGTPQAFTFKQRFPSPDVASEPDDLQPEAYCSGWT